MRQPSIWLKPFSKGSWIAIILAGSCRTRLDQPTIPLPEAQPYYFRDATAEIERGRRMIAQHLMPFVYRLEVTAKYRYRTEHYRGTGWQWQDEFIWTCEHLIPSEAETHIEVWDKEGTCTEAELVWRDTLVDAAILRVKGYVKGGLSTRDDSVPGIGETVYTLGAPLGLLGTLQEGFISAEGRLLGTKAQHIVLQLSLPAQSGSSGSPVVDRQGRVVGMISNIASLSGGYEGISFAIPAQVLKRVWERYRSFAANDTQGYSSGR
ncbi:MAG: S1C family serine protease [Bacteroidia bacterium]|nr:S1C family serine protease [Bacteroidia bacterium]